MKKIILFLICSSLCCYATAQKNKNPFQMVNVPDTIYKQLENAYIQEGRSVASRINVFNVEDPKDLVFKNGIYSYRLSGPHFDRRLFIYNNGKVYIFTTVYVDDVIAQYLECIAYLDLTEKEKFKYLKMITECLESDYDDYMKTKKIEKKD